jgi:hypothetical protein
MAGRAITEQPRRRGCLVVSWDRRPSRWRNQFASTASASQSSAPAVSLQASSASRK